MSDIKTWKERLSGGYEACDQVDAMQSEISELRAELDLHWINKTLKEMK